MASMQITPIITVLMSVYNGEATLPRAIESILDQVYTDFEFIIIDDGSTDRTSEIIDLYAQKDSRIIHVRQDNMGLTRSLNKGISMARGRYIARQDADDISYRERLSIQCSFMNDNLDVVLCGGDCLTIYPATGFRYEWGWKDEREIADSIAIKTPFAHSTAFYRTDIAKKLGGYDVQYRTAQDMELWNRMAQVGRVAMVKEMVGERYIYADSISMRRRWRQARDAMRIRRKYSSAGYPAILYHTGRSLLINALPPELMLGIKKAFKTLKA